MELKNIDFDARRVIVAEGTYTEAKPHHPFRLGSTAATKRTEENGGDYVRTHRLWSSHPIDTGINLKNFACDPSKLEDIPLPLDLVTIVGGTNPAFWEVSLLKSFVVALMALCCITVKAQTFGGDHDTVRTIAATLQISKIVRPGSDGVTFDVELDGKPFDQLYGSRYVYYPDSKDQDKAVSRMIMEDFSGGFSDPPTVSLYDFRQKSAAVLPISDKLDVQDIRWLPNRVLLSVEGRWFAFANGKLVAMRNKRK
ncbi:TPA: hypothetical protein QDC51_001527 [Burkholderia multivorans]|uniref:hypothetical protein n=1 Tax=Burkholderia multivorans TaxID=87883 RepID=UPI0004F7A4D1|nr:hypothetical protein [Burkholderia multivorans]AIO77331.1 hypothetical protein DM80_1192 [Burkholderia multivorans]AOK66520.1 hypothetical protein WM33_12795 [Burkholderia multivorans]KVZ81139.1 hypothetical protein WL23_13000 [Burkholderia multivorans]MBU9352893.1 hypothetical protein [Burkholderia multivorans]MBU9390770.1 hypothetical protein [Burkholderia multivorans]